MFKMNANSMLVFLLAALSLASPSLAAEEISNPVVIELFTSQGCSDAPPADRLAEELSASNKNITVLTCHVGYLSFAGWKDTLAEKFCETRLKRYADTFGISSTKTPQLIINGIYNTIDESEEAIRSTLYMAQQKQDKMYNFGLHLEPNSLSITLPDAELDQHADIWLFGFDREHIVDIKAGQNAGNTMKYINVARHLVKILKWEGPSISYTMNLNLVPADGYTIIAQYKNQGKIIGASTILKSIPIASDQQ